MDNSNIPTEPTTAPAPTEPGKGQFDLDKIFGDPKDTSGEGISKGVEPQPAKEFTGRDTLPPLESEIFGELKAQGFKGQPNAPNNPEEVIRRLQSERDKALSQLQNWETQAADWKTANDFLAELEDNAEIRHAFIAELEPDLVKPKNPYDLIQETLGKEFTDFTPNPDEANVFGSKTWMYNRRAEDLLTEIRTKSKSALPTSLKDIREKRKREAVEQKQAAFSEKKKIMTDMKWNENTWEGFAGWMQATQGTDWAKMYSYLLRTTGQQPTPLATQRGSSIRNDRGAAFENLGAFYG
jgi:hypothetical protein